MSPPIGIFAGCQIKLLVGSHARSLPSCLDMAQHCNNTRSDARVGA